MTDHTQPEALRLAAALEYCDASVARQSIKELHRQYARIAELEAQLDSIGAGGVNGPLMAPAAGNAVSEAYGWLYDWTHSSATGRPDEHFTGFTKDKDHALKHRNVTAVYIHPSPPEGMAVTDAMIDAGKKMLHNSNGRGARAKVERIFTAMIAAAPGPADGESNG